MFLKRSFLPNYDAVQLRLISDPQNSRHSTLLALWACSRLVQIKRFEAPESKDRTSESVEVNGKTEHVVGKVESGEPKSSLISISFGAGLQTGVVMEIFEEIRLRCTR